MNLFHYFDAIISAEIPYFNKKRNKRRKALFPLMKMTKLSESDDFSSTVIEKIKTYFSPEYEKLIDYQQKMLKDVVQMVNAVVNKGEEICPICWHHVSKDNLVPAYTGNKRHAFRRRNRKVCLACSREMSALKICDRCHNYRSVLYAVIPYISYSFYAMDKYEDTMAKLQSIGFSYYKDTSRGVKPNVFMTKIIKKKNDLYILDSEEVKEFFSAKVIRAYKKYFGQFVCHNCMEHYFNEMTHDNEYRASLLLNENWRDSYLKNSPVGDISLSKDYEEYWKNIQKAKVDALITKIQENPSILDEVLPTLEDLRIGKASFRKYTLPWHIQDTIKSFVIKITGNNFTDVVFEDTSEIKNKYGFTILIPEENLIDRNFENIQEDFQNLVNSICKSYYHGVEITEEDSQIYIEDGCLIILLELSATMHD